MSNKKKPVILGGEHTITYSLFKEFAKNEPLLLHFDAHRDLKPLYDGMKICHTTPFYHLINEGYLNGQNLVQIGIRQGDKNENLFALERGIITFDAWDCYNSFSNLKHWLKENSKNRDIYISFDVDSLDSSITKGTGTPVSNGLREREAEDLISKLMQNRKVCCFEISEVNPTLDKENLMAEIAFNILQRSVNVLMMS